MSYRTIVSVVNEHTASTVTARYAMAMAVSSGSGLVLYAVHSGDADESTLRHSERHLEHLFAMANEQGIPVTRVVETGSIVRLLPHYIQAENADLVFYPVAPGEQYGAPLQQQTIHQLLHTVRSDLAIMRIVHMGRVHPASILAPFGATIRGRGKREQFIIALAKSFHSQVTLFHLGTGSAGSGMPGDIARFRDELHRQKVTVLERSGRGLIAKAITVEAITRHNDLIVLGASERNALQRLLGGNPAGDVMLKPPCNAILFRAAL